MHRILRERLRVASGQSQFVVAINIDIRGFSSFFSDSAQAAAYLSSAYTTILDDYFPEHSFFKPTGDGLLLVRQITRDNLEETITSMVEAALRLESNFSTICAKDRLITFPTPDAVGIGFARETATCLKTGRYVLDYSGFPLNLASRLMDLARPHGVVLDGVIADDLPAKVRGKFVDDSVYIKGLAEGELRPVARTQSVAILEANRRPFGTEDFVEPTITRTVKDLEKHGPSFRHVFSRRPASAASIRMYAEFPSRDAHGELKANMVGEYQVEARKYEERYDGPGASFDYDKITNFLRTKRMLQDDDEVRLRITYIVPRDERQPSTA